MDGEHKKQMIETYDRSAAKLADYFKGIGSRTMDIELVLAHVERNPYVLEVGCGDGRDSKEIVEHAGEFIGMDISKGMIDIAKQAVPNARFEVADIETYDIPEGVDAVIAFASLLHVPKEVLPDIFERIHASLSESGVLYVSMKTRPEYEAEVKSDDFGDRMFYYYTEDLLRELAGDLFEELYVDHQKIGSTTWVSFLWRKQ